MSFRINTHTARTYTRAALGFSVITSAIQACVLLVAVLAGASFLVRTLGLSTTFIYVASAVLFSAFVISAVRDIYLISRISTEMNKAGLDLDSAGAAGTAPPPANPNALLQFEQRMVDMARPFAWARAIVGVMLGVVLVALTVIALRHFGPPDSSNLVVYLFGLMFVLVVVGSTVSDVYSTWAMFSIPLSEKKNVVVKPLELLLLVIWLCFFAAFASIFASSGSPPLIATAAVVILIAAAMMIKSYRATVSRTIVNPIDVAPIMIDPSEMITISIAGVTMIGAGILQKVGFGRRLSQQFYSPQSGRKLNPWAQNALLASDTRLYFIFIPIGLGDQEESGMAELESLFSGKQIRAKLDEMLQSMTLRQIYESNAVNFALELSDISRVDILKRTSTRQYIAFVDRNGDRIRALVDESPELDAFLAQAPRTGNQRRLVDA